MVKKEFTNGILKRLNDLSDIELIEELDRGTFGSGEAYNNLIKALLDKRLKTAIQDLNRNTMRYSRRLIDLTILLFFLALIQTLISIMAIPESWLIKILITITVIYSIYYIARRVVEEKNKSHGH